MTHSQNYASLFNSDEREAILLSIKPRFAELITAGSKRIELRRAIPKKTIKTIVIYASSPIQSIVALADVAETIEAKPNHLWQLSKSNGGGLSKLELQAYFSLKIKGFAFILENIRVFDSPINPKKIFKDFTAPQSFKYITAKELTKLTKLLES